MTRQVAAGLVIGVMGVSIALAVAALVFRGALADDYAVGAGWALAGFLALGVVAALGSSFRGLVAGPQDAPAVLIGSVAATLAAATRTPIPTLAAFVVTAAVLTGVGLVLLGRFGLGGLVRFVPYPVIAGFFGGTGMILVAAGTDWVVRGGVTAELGLRVVPTAILAVALVWLGRRPSPAILPASLIVLGLVGYHLGALGAGIDRSSAVERGLVLGPFPSGSLLDLGVVARLGEADWGAVVGQVPAMLGLALLVAIGLLLNTGGLEHAFDQDADVDRELVATGAGLLLAAPFAGIPGYVQAGPTIMGRRIGGGGRVPPLVATGVAAVVLVFGPDLLTLVPVLVPAALLLAIGFDFLLSWVWDVRRRVRPFEYVVILAIVAVVATVGFLEGIGLGVLAATALFVLRYSRVSAVRRSTTLRDRRSHAQRSPEAYDVLVEQGHRVRIVELQGFVFFGTAEQAVGSIVERLEQDPDVEVLVLDLHHVTGLDSSANAAFQRLARVAADQGVEVVFSDGDPEVRTSLAPAVRDGAFTLASDLDRALEACEERLLKEATGAATPAGLRSSEIVGPFRDAPVRQVPAGETILTAGTRDVGLYLLEAGRAVVLDGTDHAGARHALLLPGTVIGEVSLVSGQPANATVTCETDCVVRHLTPGEVEHLAEVDPRAALDLHRFIARRLAGKLDAANRTVRSLQ